MKKQDKFEEKLNEQLNGMEFKPSDALWNRIEKNLDTDGFEPALQQKLASYSVDPNEKVWTGIEEQLPEPRKRKGLAWFSWIAVVVLAVGFGAGYWFNSNFSIRPANEINGQTVIKAEPKVAENTKGAVRTPQVQNVTAASELADADNNTPVNAPQHISPVPHRRMHEIAEVAAAQASEPASRLERSQRTLVNHNNHVTRAGRHTAIASAEPLHGRSGNTAPDQSSANATMGNENIRTNAAAQPQAPLPAPPVPNQGIDATAPGNNAGMPSLSTTPAAADPVPGAKDTSVAASSPAPVPAPDANGVRAMSPVNNADGMNARDAKDANLKDTFANTPAAPVNNNNYNDPLTQISDISVTITAGVQMCFMNLAMPSDNQFKLEQAYALRKKMETPSLDYNGGFLLNYHINSKWTISSGIQITSFRQTLNYSLIKASDTPSYVQPVASYKHPYDSIVSGTQNVLENKYSFTEIPVYIGYNVYSGASVDFDLQASVSYGVLNLVNAYMPDPTCVGLLSVQDKTDFPHMKNIFFAGFSPAIGFKNSSTLSFGLMPTFKMALGNMVGDNTWIQQRPWFAGLNVYIKKRF